MNTETATTDLAERLRDAMKAQGDISVRELGRLAGVPHTGISRILTGKIAAPKFENVEKLARALDTTAGALLGTAHKAPAMGDLNGVELLAVSMLSRSPINPRRAPRAEDVADLAVSIAKQGILQNLTVRPAHISKPNAGYEVIIGGRRLAACRLNIDNETWPSNATIPCRVVDIDDLAALTMATAENVARESMHPLEEGEAFAAIEDRGVDKVAIAGAVGKTPRFVQERIRLGRNLADTAKEAFLEDRMTIDQARELARAPATAQKAVIVKAKSGHDGGSTKDREFDFHRVSMRDLRTELRNPYPLESAAIFDRAAYEGEMIVAEEGGEALPETMPGYSYQSPYGIETDEARFADVEAFKRLQNAALQARKEELLAGKGCKWVDIVEIPNYAHSVVQYGFSGSSRESDGSGRGAVIGVCPKSLSVREFLKVYRKGDGKEAARQEKADGPAAPEGPTDPIEGIRTGRKEYAKRTKTIALRRKIAADPHAATVALLVSLLCGKDSEGTTIGQETMYSAQEQGMPDEILAVFSDAVERLGPPLRMVADWPYIELAGASEEERYLYGAARDAARAMITRALLQWEAEELSALLAALVARSMVVNVVSGLGDPEQLTDLVEHLNFEMGEHWSMDEAYLKTLEADALRRLAVRIMVPMEPAEIRKSKLGPLRQAILDHQKVESLNYVPPEIEFGDQEMIEKRIREMADKADKVLAAKA